MHRQITFDWDLPDPATERLLDADFEKFPLFEHSLDDGTDLDYEIGTCQTCGGYGKYTTTCGRTDACREYGSEYM